MKKVIINKYKNPKLKINNHETLAHWIIKSSGSNTLIKTLNLSADWRCVLLCVLQTARRLRTFECVLNPLAPEWNYECNIRNAGIEITGFNFLNRTIITGTGGRQGKAPKEGCTIMTKTGWSTWYIFRKFKPHPMLCRMRVFPHKMVRKWKQKMWNLQQNNN
jgi:hypothetical protein